MCEIKRTIRALPLTLVFYDREVTGLDRPFLDLTYLLQKPSTTPYRKAVKFTGISGLP